MDLKSHPKAVSVIAAASLLSIGRSKVYDLLNSGDLPSFKIGRRRLIRTDVIDDFLIKKSR